MKAAAFALFVIVTSAVMLGRSLTRLPQPPVLVFRPAVVFVLTRTEVAPQVVYRNAPVAKCRYVGGWGPIPEGWEYRCINIDQVRRVVSGRAGCQ